MCFNPLLLGNTAKPLCTQVRMLSVACNLYMWQPPSLIQSPIRICRLPGQINASLTLFYGWICCPEPLTALYCMSQKVFYINQVFFSPSVASAMIKMGHCVLNLQLEGDGAGKLQWHMRAEHSFNTFTDLHNFSTFRLILPSLVHEDVTTCFSHHPSAYFHSSSLYYPLLSITHRL